MKTTIFKKKTFVISFLTIAFLGLLYPFVVEFHFLEVINQIIPIQNLPDKFDGYKIVQLTDFHYGKLVPKHVIERAVFETIKANPDLVVLTGDYLNDHYTESDKQYLFSELKKIAEKFTVISVLGNHDHWIGAEPIDKELRAVSSLLRNEVIPIDIDSSRVWIAGAGDFWEENFDLSYLTANIPKNETVIVLAHNPDQADAAEDGRYQLFICGHTHGGQVSLPIIGPIRMPVKNYKYSSGLKFKRDGTPVYISKGIGWAPKRIRFNCKPDISILTLRKAVDKPEENHQ